MKKAPWIFFSFVVFGFLGAGVLHDVQAGWREETEITGEALKHIEENYLYPVDLAQCRYDMLRGLSQQRSDVQDSKEKTDNEQSLRCFDNYSFFLTPGMMRNMEVESTGRFIGFGIKMIEKNGLVVVYEVFEGSPAHDAGVRAGDIIRSIRWDGEQVQKPVMGLQDAVLRLSKEGSDGVFFTFERGGTVIRTGSIVQREIIIKHVFPRNLDNSIVYVRLKDFDGDASDVFYSTLRLVKPGDDGQRRVLVDVRGNPGGPTLSVEEMLYEFSNNPDDIMAVFKYRNGEEEIDTIGNPGALFVDPETNKSKDPGEFSKYNVVILTDEMSASASEIFSGTMQDWGFVVVGGPTKGKGGGQKTFPLSDGSGLRLTIFEFLVGNAKKQVQYKGVIPNVAVSDTRVSVDDTATERDEQFIKALLILEHLPKKDN